MLVMAEEEKPERLPRRKLMIPSDEVRQKVTMREKYLVPQRDLAGVAENLRMFMLDERHWYTVYQCLSSDMGIRKLSAAPVNSRCGTRYFARIVTL